MQILIGSILFVLISATPFIEGQTFDPTKNDPICGTGSIQLVKEPVNFAVEIKEVTTASLTCSYQITTFQHSYIEFKMTALNIDSKSNCDNGYLNVSSSIDRLKTTKNQFCGNRLPTDVVSSIDKDMVMLLYLTKGLKDVTVKGILKRIIPPNDPACGPQTLTLTEESAQLVIPASGKSFTQPTRCVYFIQGNSQKNMSFELSKLNLGTTVSCTTDFIKVAANESGIGSTKYIFCGTVTPKDRFNSSTNTLYIEMHTISDPTKTSIVANYRQNAIPQLQWSKFVLLPMVTAVIMY